MKDGEVVVTPDRTSAYYDYIRVILASGDQLAYTVKLADLADHLRPTCPVRLRRRYELAKQMMEAEAMV